MTKEKKLVEYPDAPSGSVYFYNYKEPLMPYVGEYGYQGAVIFDQAEGTIQCHLCGEWHAYLPYHLRKEHNTSAQEYRDEVGLNKSTVLISENIRAKMIESGHRNPNALKNKKLWKKTHKGKKTRGNTGKTQSKEKKNNMNTCPEQLLERLDKLCKQLGRTPTAKEVMFRPVLRKTYGSLSNALRILGHQTRPTGNHLNGIVYSKEDLIKILQDFKKREGRVPSYSDSRRKIIPDVRRFKRQFGSWKEALKAAKV